MKARSLSMLGALVIVAASCGGDAADTTSSSSTEPSSTTTTTVPTTTSTEAATTTTEPSQTVTVFFSAGGDDCAAVSSYERTGPAGSDPMALAFDELLEGSTPEEEAVGAGSFFSVETADAVRSVALEDRLLTVDFTDIRFLNNASTSCGSAALVASLAGTAFQFEEVERVTFTILGSCSLFWNWLQAECSEVTRDGAVATPVDVNALAAGSGCTPGSAELPDGTWFGYVSEATPDTVIFDLACWFSGVGGIEAALEDGQESPPPNDYYIRNTSPETRRIPVSSDVTVAWLAPEDITRPEPIPYSTWIEERTGRTWVPAVWLVIEDAAVVSIEEQYQP